MKQVPITASKIYVLSNSSIGNIRCLVCSLSKKPFCISIKIKIFFIMINFLWIYKKSIENYCFQHFLRVGLLNFHLSVSSSYGNRTRDSAVRGRRLDLLTNEPSIRLFYSSTIYWKLQVFYHGFIDKIFWLWHFFIN